MSNEYIYTPGHEVTVEVQADSNGDVAREGDGVAAVDETESAVIVELVEAVSDRCVGLLKTDPVELDDPDNSASDYAAGDTVGLATLVLGEFVVWMKADDAYTASVGDYVEVGDGGDVEAYTGPTAAGQNGAVTNNLGVAGDGTIENDSANDIDLDFTAGAFPYGYVYTTIAREWGVQGKVAVIKGVM